MNYSFSRENRLKSKVILASLFEKGSLFVSKPFLVKYQLTVAGRPSIQAAFSVPKRRFKRAVDRNLLKRRMRELHRLNQHELLDKLSAGPYKLDLIYVYSSSTIFDYQHLANSYAPFLEQIKIP